MWHIHQKILMKYVNEKNKLSFTVTRDIPDGYELVEHGVLYNKQQMETEPTEDTFVFGKEGVNKFVSPTTKLSGVVILNVNMTGYENVKVAARGYMIVKNSSNEEEIYYTDVKYISYNEMNEKTEGDN